MNQQWIKQLFMIGYNQTVIVERVNILNKDESLLIHLGNRFVEAHKSPPTHIFLDAENTLNLSEDLIDTYGVFVLNDTVTLIDEDGQFCKIEFYPSALRLIFEPPRNHMKIPQNCNAHVS